MTPMRIAVSNASPIIGGAELMTEALSLGLRERGHEVTLFCRPGSPLEARLRGRLPCEPILRGFDLHPRTQWRCAQALRRHRPQVLMTTTLKDPRLIGPAARLLGIPVVVREAMDHPYKNRLRYRLFYGWVPIHFITNSEATRCTVLGSAPWIDAAQVSTIYNGIDAGRFADAEPLDLGLPEDAVAVGYVGRLEARKGVRELAAAWPRVAEAVPQAHLVLAGKGPLEAEIRERLAGVPRVRWLGFREDVPQLMRALDVLLVPSHWEGFGLVAVEVMAAGVPVVATRASSLPELLDDGVQGRLVPVQDPGALAAAAIELARDPGLRARMGRAGQARVRSSFTFDRMLDEYEACLVRIGHAASPRGR
jgi:glycosyltransferase involved in cell wall biosynthesis